MKKIVSIVFIVVLVISLFLINGNSHVQVTHFSVKSEKLTGQTKDYKIAQISDFHNSKLGKQTLKKLKKENPDIIVITGDLIDANHTDTDISIHLVDGLVKIAPVYYVTGNHEAWIPEYEKLKDRIENKKVHILNNTSEKITEEITITGIEDPDFLQENDVGSVGKIEYKLSKINIDADKYNILLSHRPEAFSVHQDYDLILAGHAHGGQFRVPFIGGLAAPDQGLFPQYDGGEYVSGFSHMIVSRGIGNSIIPVRVNNTPEIVVVTLSGK